MANGESDTDGGGLVLVHYSTVERCLFGVSTLKLYFLGFLSII